MQLPAQQHSVFVCLSVLRLEIHLSLYAHLVQLVCLATKQDCTFLQIFAMPEAANQFTHIHTHTHSHTHTHTFPRTREEGLAIAKKVPLHFLRGRLLIENARCGFVNLHEQIGRQGFIKTNPGINQCLKVKYKEPRNYSNC